MSNQHNFHYTSKIRIFYDEPRFGPGVASLLELVNEYGSINKACTKMNMAYSKAWKILKAAEKDLGFPLLCRVTGGKGGGFSKLTPEGQHLLTNYLQFSKRADKAIEHSFFRHFHDFMPKESFLRNQLALPDDARIISIIGGGGKTSTMYRLAKEYAAIGKKVLITTSTHILVPSPEEVPVLLYYPVSSEQLADTFSRFPIVAVAAKDKEKEGKLSAVPAHFYEKALETADIILCEADGAKMLPIKAPAFHEPAIVPESDYILILAGLSCLHKPLKEVCHRKDLAARLLGVTPSTLITTDILAQLITDSDGLMKNLHDKKEKVRIFLNQADTEEQMTEGNQVALRLTKDGLEHVFVGSLHRDFSL
ncbi:MAG: selenium cofactor biosynthesis protein YqeC [Lachnospiraceae bacterium]|nr:selenium cofactor biosynthesis protein YqeC [Lachnospiraceae bacterium]